MRGSWSRNDERVRFSHPLLAARVEAELEPGGAGRCIVAWRSWSTTPSSAHGTSRSARTALERGRRRAGGRRFGRGVAWRVGRSGGAGRARRLAHAGRGARCPVPTRQLLAADHHYASGDVERSRSRSSSRCSSSSRPVPSARRCCGGSAWSRRTTSRGRSGCSSRRSSRPRPIPAAGRDRRLRDPDRVPSPRAGGGGVAGARFGSGRGGQRRPRPARRASWRSSASRSCCADGVTPGLLERALELEELVGPLPVSR